jgi:hypothetical protein
LEKMGRQPSWKRWQRLGTQVTGKDKEKWASGPSVAHRVDWWEPWTFRARETLEVARKCPV